jgi:hypothetical protein
LAHEPDAVTAPRDMAAALAALLRGGHPPHPVSLGV